MQWARSRPTTPTSSTASRVPENVYSQLNNAATGYPLLNRAIQSDGPTGSTFKPITATAALESGAWNVERLLRRHREILHPTEGSAGRTPAARPTAWWTW